MEFFSNLMPGLRKPIYNTIQAPATLRFQWPLHNSPGLGTGLGVFNEGEMFGCGRVQFFTQRTVKPAPNEVMAFGDTDVALNVI